jgi:hypothetical protein
MTSVFAIPSGSKMATANFTIRRGMTGERLPNQQAEALRLLSSQRWSGKCLVRVNQSDGTNGEVAGSLAEVNMGRLDGFQQDLFHVELKVREPDPNPLDSRLIFSTQPITGGRNVIVLNVDVLAIPDDPDFARSWNRLFQD